MADPVVEWLKSAAAQYMANNGIETVTNEVLAHVMTVAGDNKLAAAVAVAQLLGN